MQVLYDWRARRAGPEGSTRMDQLQEATGLPPDGRRRRRGAGVAVGVFVGGLVIGTPRVVQPAMAEAREKARE